MALQPQKIPLELTTGIDTKTDKFNSVSFRNVENFRFNKPGALHKVPGYTAYNTTLQNLGSNMPAITSASAIYSYKDELLMNTPQQLLAYSTSLSKWVSKNYFNVNGTAYSSAKKVTGITFVETETQPKVENFTRFSNTDYYVDSTYQVYTVSDPVSNDIKIRIDLLDGGTTLLNSYIPTMIGAPPYAKLANRTTRIAGIYQGYLYVCVYSAAAPDYALYKYDLSLPNNNPTRFAIASSDFNAVYLDGTAGIIYFFGANGTTLYQATFTISSSLLFYAVGTCPSGYTTSFVDNFTAGGLLKITGQSGNSLYTANITKVTLGLSGVFTLITNTSAQSTTACDGTNVYYIWKDTTTVNGGVHIIALASDNSTNVIGGVYKIAGFCNIAGKAIYDAGNIYINAYTHQNNLKTNYITKITPATIFENINWEIIAKSGFLESNSANIQHRLFKISNSIYMLQTVLSEDSVGMLFTDNDAKQNIELVKHTIDIDNTGSTYENNTLFIPSSVSRSYDGANITEHSFLDMPEFASPITTQVGGIFTAGTYGIAIIYTWTDNNGHKYKSAPFFSSWISTGVAEDPVLTVSCLHLTMKENVFIETYLTLQDGTVYYKYDTENSVANNATATIVLARATYTPTQQAEQEVLYTTGGVLENDAPEPATASTTFKNRVWLANANQIQYSKLISTDDAVDFNGLLTIRPDNSYGKITGVRGMDNVLLIFTEENVLIQSGDGPNNLGEQNDFGIPQLISADAGCTEPRSIVSTPDGVLFKSEKGIYIINRGLYVSYIGAPVEDYNDEPVLGAQLLNNTNEVRFLLSDKILSYDYLLKQWSIFTNINATTTDCIIHANNFHYLKSNGVVHQQNDSLFTNVGAYYAGKLETAWITVAGINSAGATSRSQQGFQRLYNINMLGQYKSAHNVTVGIAYNYDDTIIDTATIVPTGVGVYQFEVPPSIQKCEAFKLFIQDTNQSGTGESLVLSNILLEVGIKGTAQKVTPDGNRFPTS